MGYSTDFRGQFKIAPALSERDRLELENFVRMRHEGPDGYEDPTKPGYYCQWEPSQDGKTLAWDGGEKFYNYVPWLRYLKEKFFDYRGYKLSGSVEWCGEDRWNDRGKISIVKGEIRVRGTPRA